MMNFEKFVEWVADDLQRLLGEDYRIESTLVRKNNGVDLKALIVRNKKHNAEPVVYVEPLYQAYKNGSSIKKITQQILTKMKTELPLSMEMAEQIRDLEAVRDRIGYRLVSKSKNEELLKGIPWTPWYDLAIIYYLHLGVREDKQVTTIIHNYQMQEWNLSVDDLYELAKENTPKLCPVTMGRLEHLLFGWDEDEEQMVSCDSVFPILYLLSNQTGINGAVCMLYEGIIKDFAEKIGSDLIILPSSINEVLLLKYDADVELEMFKNMVKSVNEESVPAEEVLSDSLYIYTRADDKIKIV